MTGNTKDTGETMDTTNYCRECERLATEPAEDG
jgi:hypothetical protein